MDHRAIKSAIEEEVVNEETNQNYYDKEEVVESDDPSNMSLYIISCDS